MNGYSAAASPWQEARTPDGRPYYYHTQTKETRWQKPEELLTPVEQALARQPWKEYTAPDGRKYYAHSETKQTVWEMPAPYKEALNTAEAQAPPTPAAHTPAPAFSAGGSTALQAYTPRDIASSFDSRRENIPLPAVTKEAIPDYSSFEEAEAAFMKLLKRSNVQPDWSWEQTMRTTIKDPQYRALKDPKDRKAAFEKYAVEVREQEKEKAKERLAKLRTDFGNMLKTHPEIKHYSRWRTVRPMIERETVFRSTDNEEERKQFFAEYIVELKKQNIEQEAANRRTAINDLAGIMKALDLEPYTRWSEAQEKIQSNEHIQKDPRFKLLSKSDILTAFENHIKSLERSFNDARQQQKTLKTRRERQRRDAFMGLLREKRSQGLIKAGAKWSMLLPHIEDDPRYVGMLGQSGSTPLDLFWDMIEDEERALRGRRNDVYDVLEVSSRTVTSDLLLTAHRTSDLRSQARPISMSFLRLCSLIAEQPILTKTYYISSSRGSKTRCKSGKRRRNTQPTDIDDVRLMLFDHESSTSTHLFESPTHGRLLSRESRRLKNIALLMTRRDRRPSTKSSSDSKRKKKTLRKSVNDEKLEEATKESIGMAIETLVAVVFQKRPKLIHMRKIASEQ